MLVDSADVGAALSAGNGCLIRAELWLHCRTQVAGNGGPEEPPEAAGELQGAHASRVLRSRVLEDPDKQVKGRAKHVVQRSLTHVRSV